MNTVLGTLKADIDAFIMELARTSFLPVDQATEALSVSQGRAGNLPDRIRDAIISGDCVFVERLVTGRWQYSLQAGDMQVSSWLPSFMRSSILRPIANRLTPVGDGSQLVWCCLAE